MKYIFPTIILVLLFNSSLYAVCPFADCTSVSEQAGKEILQDISDNGDKINDKFDEFAKAVASEKDINSKTVEELIVYISRLKTNLLVLEEIDFEAKKQVKLLKLKAKEGK